jgi:hypothetical protein
MDEGNHEIHYQSVQIYDKTVKGKAIPVTGHEGL